MKSLEWLVQFAQTSIRQKLDRLRGDSIQRRFFMVQLNHRVYFAKCENFVKIGSTKDPLQARLSAMQVGNPFVIQGLGVIECDCDRKSNYPNKECSQKDQIQSLFRKSKKRGEWYHATPELLDHIKNNALKSSPEGYVIYDPPSL